MDDIIPKLQSLIKGEVQGDYSTRKRASHDASVYELIPQAVISPTDSTDIEKLVKFVSKHKSTYPNLSLTPRSAGTDMTGGPLSSSLIVDMMAHFNTIESLQGFLLKTQPGVTIRDVDPLLNEKSLQLGCVPASRAINTIGGIVANNSGGERSLQYGNTEHWVRELKVVLSDGHEYNIKPLNRKQLQQMIKENTYEASLYQKTYELIETNYDLIKNAKPHVHKNSMGYNLWSVWDRDTGIFDMTRLFSGSQGTLGIITDVTIEAVPKAPHSGLLLAYLPSIKNLGEVIKAVMKHQPATFEGFDTITFNLGIRHFKTFQKQLGLKEMLRQQAILLKSAAQFKGHIPSIFLMIEFDGQTKEEVLGKISKLHDDLKKYKIKMDIAEDDATAAPFWRIRRASLSLLQTQIHGRYATAFIDDLVVPPHYLSEFIPKLRKIIRKYKLPATIQGHFGDGNFHIIPLMDIAGSKDRAKLEPVMRELIPIVTSYGGTMAGEHNDGMVRGPWLPAVFGQDVYQIFKQTKEIFDPLYIFNPHKKTDASWEYSMSHIRNSNTTK